MQKYPAATLVTKGSKRHTYPYQLPFMCIQPIMVAQLMDIKVDRHRFGITDTLHHCRACGEGFCHPCSDFKVNLSTCFPPVSHKKSSVVTQSSSDPSEPMS